MHRFAMSRHIGTGCRHDLAMEADRELAAATLAASAAGFVTVAELVAAGFTRSEIRTRIEHGGWDRAGRGLVRIPDHDSADLWNDRVHRAIASAGRAACAGGYTAARLLGIAGGPATAAICIVVPQHRHPVARPGVTIVRSDVPAAQAVVTGGHRCTSALRTVVDCARFGPLTPATSVIESAARQQLVTVAEVTRRQTAVQGQRGAARLLDALQHVDLRSESPLETRVRLLLLADGLPYPDVQHAFDTGGVVGRIDLAYPAPPSGGFRGLAIEVDGRAFHARDAAFHRDAVRQTALEEDDWLVRRFTNRQIEQSRYVVETVRRAMTRIGVRL